MDWILLLVVVLAVIAVGVWMFVKDKKEKDEAIPAEQRKALAAPVGRTHEPGRVIRRLKGFAGDNGYEVIVPGRICQGAGVTDFDAIVVGSFGVLAVTSLGYPGKVYGNEKEKLWTQTTNRGRVAFENPLTVQAAQARMLREVLFANKLRSVPVETMCVFPNSGTELLVPRSTPILRMKEFSAMLRKDHFTDDKKVDIDAVAKALRAAAEKK